MTNVKNEILQASVEGTPIPKKSAKKAGLDSRHPWMVTAMQTERSIDELTRYKFFVSCRSCDREDECEVTQNLNELIKEVNG